MPTKIEELTGIYEREGFRNDDNWFFGFLEDGTKISGVCEPGTYIPGIQYRFLGQWDKQDTGYGPQFKVKASIQSEPHTRAGVVEYLARYAPGIGTILAHRLCDTFSADKAIGVLKTDSKTAAAKVSGLNFGAAELAAVSLQHQEHFQETKIDLLDLFAKRGFPHVLVDLACDKWGVKAAQRIRRDPFVLLVTKMPGCGFLRVDSLYLDLGLPPDRLKRQVMAAWHVIHSDMSGSTWYRWARIVEEIGRRITGELKAEKALKVAVRADWLAVREVGGEVWLADAKRARAEGYCVEKILELMG
jgi:hypothetical protein